MFLDINMDEIKQTLGELWLKLEGWLAIAWEYIWDHKWLIIMLSGIIVVGIIVVKAIKSIPYKRTTITEVFDETGKRRDD